MNRKELTVIKQAIINEIEGYEFYRLAAQQTEADESKKAFETLAEEEFMHVEWLKKICSNLNSNTEDDLILAFEVEVPNTENLQLGERRQGKRFLSSFCFWYCYSNGA